MKNLSLFDGLARALAGFVVFGFFLLAFATGSHAQTTTFAQFVEQNGSQDFIFTNNGSSAEFKTIPGGSPIYFFYQNISGLPVSLQGLQFARLYVTTTTAQAAALNAGNLNQALDQTVTIQIIRDTPAPAGTGGGTRTNLLTAVFTPSTNTPGIVGTQGGNSATLSATTPDHTVTFTSDFLSFATTSQRNLAFSFSSVSPSLNLGAGNFLDSFAAAATGTLASNPPPVYAPPTAAAVTIAGRVLTASGQGLKNAQVTLTRADGTVLRQTTGTFGAFEFADIEVGQTIVIEAAARRYRFTPQVLPVEGELRTLSLVADN